MAIFEEYFPSEKAIIQKYAERQKKLEKLSMTLRKTEKLSKDRPKSLIPIRTRLSKFISEVHRDTEDKLKQSSDMDAKIEEIHKMIENVDNINLIMAPEKEIAGFDGSGDDHDVAGCLVDVLESEDYGMSEIATSSLSQLNEERSPKRVVRLEQNDSSMELFAYKPPRIKPTKASILMSKFNSEKSQKRATTISRSFLNKSTAKSILKTPKAVSFAKFEPPKKVESKKLSQSVRKILDDAKEKHKAKTLVKSNVPVNVVDLFLI